MNILIEWIFWIFIKWIIFLTNILVLVCQRQKLSSINVSKSSEIIQGSLMGPSLVHFRGSFTYTGASGRLRSHILALFWNFEWFSSFFLMNNSIEYSGLYWMNIFLNDLSRFCFEFNFELNHFQARFNEKLTFKKDRPPLNPTQSWPYYNQTSFPITLHPNHTQ